MADGHQSLYDYLGIQHDANQKEIVKAYRRKALVCHPDKNPDNPKAAELFTKLSDALAVLSDPKARATYDRALKAKEASRLRNQALNAKRRKLKDELESRESAAAAEQEDERLIQETLEEQIKRLRAEGSTLLKEQQDYVSSTLSTSNDIGTTPKLKVKWKCSKTDATNAGYNQDNLMDIFSKFGKVINLIISKRKLGLAIVEFSRYQEALFAAEFALGLQFHPLKISWLEGNPETDRVPQVPIDTTQDVRTTENLDETESNSNVTSFNHDDFEDLVLQRMKDAQRKREATTSLAAQQ